MKQYQFPFCGR